MMFRVNGTYNTYPVDKYLVIKNITEEHIKKRSTDLKEFFVSYLKT